MLFDLEHAEPDTLAAAASFYGTNGYVRLTGLGDTVTPLFEAELAEALGVGTGELGPILDSEHEPEQLDSAVLRRMSKVTTSPELKAALLGRFGPLLQRLLGSFVHVSSDYHIQFKSGPAGVVDHGGFNPGYHEVQGIHLLHQDFTGARMPTSPSGVTLWVPLNDCDSWTLRLFPGQHERGMLANEFLGFGDPRVAALGEPLDVRARRGEGVLFNAMMLHGSSNPDYHRRVSCDLRFFPLTAFLPSEVHVLSDMPLEDHLRGLELADSDTLRAPFLEALTFLRREVPPYAFEGRSPLLWVRYLQDLHAGDMDAARELFDRFANVEFGVDEAAAYERLFDGKRHTGEVERLRALLAGAAV